MNTEIFFAKPITILLLFAASFFSCNKDSDRPLSDYSGSYKGDIKTYLNGVLFQTLSNHTIVLQGTSTPGQVTITNNVIISNSGEISGNTLTIPRNAAAGNQYFATIEYGTGTFSGNTLTIDFHQDQTSLSDNTIVGRGQWTGVLTKQ